MRDFGIQLSVSYKNGYKGSKFIEKNKIKSIFMHESINGCSIRFRLAFIIENQDELVLSFNEVYPGYENIKKTYIACKAL